MKTLNVAYYDDHDGDRIKMTSKFRSLNRQIKEMGIQVEMQLACFGDRWELCKQIQSGRNFDLLILDMYDDATGSHDGIEVLEVIAEEERNLPTILYTSAFFRGHVIKFEELYSKYNFILGERIAKDTNTLPERILSFVTSTVPHDLFDSDYDDIFLQAEILAVGLLNLNEVLFKIKQHFSLSDKFILQRLSAGFSGAAVFRVKVAGRSFILKISKEKEKLKGEHQRAEELYKFFPQHLRISIESVPFETRDAFAILIEEVKEGETLFSWLTNEKTDYVISQFLQRLFFDDSLKDHYHQNTHSEGKFDEIFSDFSNTKFLLVRQAYNELTPILLGIGEPFNINHIKSIVVSGTFENLDKTMLLDNKFKKKLTLCHGDLHSNNIMVRGEKPVLIDTGGIRYTFWPSDICRLITHVFISGIDHGKVAFFDLGSNARYLELGSKLIRLERIEVDGVNDGFIHALNWIVENIQSIYASYFTVWEFQLGMLKELIQVSYRTSSVPPGKRALSLLLAYKCLTLANNNVLEKL